MFKSIKNYFVLNWPFWISHFVFCAVAYWGRPFLDWTVTNGAAGAFVAGVASMLGSVTIFAFDFLWILKKESHDTIL